MANEKELFTLEKPHGLGEVMISWQSGRSGYLATAGMDQNVDIYNRVGVKYERIKITGLCSGLAWDPEGDILAIITHNSDRVVLWDAHTLKVSTFETGLRDLHTCLMWSKTGQVLAVGSFKGNLSIYNHLTAKRLPVLGKHSRKIVCGAWNRHMVLGLASEDKTITLSNVGGDTLKTIPLRGDPSHLKFAEMKVDQRYSETDYTVSVLIGKKTLFLHNLTDPDNPVELAFQPRYGQVVTYQWFDDGYMLLGFSSGFFVCISTHLKEIGQELFQAKNHKEHLSDIALNLPQRKVASAGDNQVKIHELPNLHEGPTHVITLDDEIIIDKISWSDDGSLLAVTTKSGSVLVYLSQLTVLGAACGTDLAVLTSLMEVSVFSCEADQIKPEEIYKFETLVEPSVIALGPSHAAIGMNNLVYFYDTTQEENTGAIREQEYLTSVKSIKLNKEFCATLCETTVQLHMIEPSDDTESPVPEMILFPDESTPSTVITCHALTNDFLIYGTDMGSLRYFLLSDWIHSSEWKHKCGIRDIFPDNLGRHVVLKDESADGYLFSAIDEGVLEIPNFPHNCIGVLWDQSDKDVFIVYDDQLIYTFVHRRHTIYGSQIELCGSTKCPSKQLPLLLNGGHVLTVKPGGKVGQLLLSTHLDVSSNIKAMPSDKLKELLTMQISMCRFDQAFKICALIEDKEMWALLAESSLKCVNLEIAARAYCRLDDAKMVMALDSLKAVDDRLLVSAHIAMFLQEFDHAQKLYLESENPQCALEMRRDLLHWEQALQLAQNIAPDQIPSVALGFAQQLELTGNNLEALKNYERGMTEAMGDANEAHLAKCRAGVARSCIRLGDTRRGVTIACQSGSGQQLKKDCAEILEDMKQWNDAAVLYGKAGCVNQAASAYIRTKNWTAVQQLLPEVTSSKIHLQYAQASETDKRYADAVASYEKARDVDNVIRIYLNHFENPQKAVQLVEENFTANGAKMVARYFEDHKDYGSAIRFLIASGCNEQAFILARQHKQLQLLGDALVSQLTVGKITPKPADFLSLAIHYEGEKDSKSAGKYYFYAQKFQKSVFHLVQASSNPQDEQEALSMCIDAVSMAKDESLTKQLLDFLLGEADGIPKDAKFIFRFYMAQRQFKEAAKTAIIIANEEQIRGNYRNAHDVLVQLYQDLSHEGLTVPSEFKANLTLLHIYTLVRVHVRKGNHLNAARLLIKVAANISKFPAHIVPILTSTVIECSRADLRNAAFTYATMLIRPEYRSKLDAKYARKIEGVVRRPPKNDVSDADEETSPCPVCDTELPNTELDCSNCKTQIPFCLATGRHIIKGDLTECPNCNFPAIYSELIKLAEEDEPCPMCSELIYPERLSRLQDIKSYLHPEEKG